MFLNDDINTLHNNIIHNMIKMCLLYIYVYLNMHMVVVVKRNKYLLLDYTSNSKLHKYEELTFQNITKIFFLNYPVNL